MASDMILYSTWGCHLCEQAEQLVRHTPLPEQVAACRVVDIVDDEAAFARYRLMIPVLKFGEQELCWPFDAEQLAQWLKELS